MSPRVTDNRDEVEAEVLEALIDRPETGMTIFELRSHVDFDIETLEPALANLREEGLITVEYDEERSVIRPEEHVMDVRDDDSPDWFERLRRFVFNR